MSITHSRPFTTVVLFQGGDLDPLEERRAAFQRATLDALRSSTPLRIGDDGEDDEGITSEADEKAREHDEFLEEALERATKVKIAALPRKAEAALILEHPPRSDVTAPDTLGPEGETIDGDVLETFPQDAAYGFNIESIAEPLVLGCLRAWDGTDEWPPVRPDDEPRQFDTDADLQAFVDDLGDADFSRLFSAAVKLNRGGGPDPKVRLSSLLDPT